MKSEEIRNLLHAAPFVPFAVHMADGKVFTVDRPDFATLFRDGRTLFLNFEGSRFAMIDVPLILRIEGISTEHA